MGAAFFSFIQLLEHHAVGLECVLEVSNNFDAPIL
jgi:hypothetical protein